MNFEYYDRLIDKRDSSRYDLTPIFKDDEVFRNLVEDLVKPFLNDDLNKVVAIESFGFILGSAISRRINKGFIPIRKSGKLATIEEAIIRNFFLDYSGVEKGLELRRDAISKGEKILLVDEWSETGAQLKSSISLIEKLGGIIGGICLVGIERNNNTFPLLEKYKINALGISPYD